MSYELKTSANGKYMFNLKAANHQVILTSQMYASKASAENGIKSVQNHGGDQKNFELKTSSADQPYFVLKASNGQVIGNSQMYKSEAAAQKGIESVMANAASTVITEIEA